MWMGWQGSVTTSAPHPGCMNFLPFLGHSFWGLSKGGCIAAGSAPVGSRQ